MSRPADEHSAWPIVTGRRCATKGLVHWSRPVVAAYLAGGAPAPTGEPDACLSTHTRVRLQRNSAGDEAATIVHRIDAVLPADPYLGLAGIYITGCGLYFRVYESIRTAATVTCGRLGCPLPPRTHERPVTVATPPGPCHGVARQKTARRDATGNSVAIRADRDPLRSVKDAAANRANGQPRSQVATAGTSRSLVGTMRTTSPGRAAGPSEGEPRVLESAATQALHPTARAGVPHERPSLPPADGDDPDGSDRRWPAYAPQQSPPIGPDRGEPPTHPALAASVMRAVVSSATGLPTVDLASTPARTRTPASLCRGGVLPTNAPIDLRKREALT